MVCFIYVTRYRLNEVQYIVSKDSDEWEYKEFKANIWQSGKRNFIPVPKDIATAIAKRGLKTFTVRLIPEVARK